MTAAALAAAIAAALGGAPSFPAAIRTELDLAAAARTGIAAEAAGRVVDNGLLSADELYALVIPRRTYDRRRQDGQPLTVAESDRLLRVVRVAVRAADALGDRERGARWLRSPNRALQGAEPLSLLDTDIGARLVEQALGRIEHGVYS